MAEVLTRPTMIRRLIEAARRDPRIVGLADYGSSSEGRGDEWSDIDVAVFLRDGEYDGFEQQWKSWAAQLGPLLLATSAASATPGRCTTPRPCPCVWTSPSTARAQ